MNVRDLWRSYGLSITLAALFLVSLALQTWMGWEDFVAEQQAHGEEALPFGDGGYFWRWGEATFEKAVRVPHAERALPTRRARARPCTGPARPRRSTCRA